MKRNARALLKKVRKYGAKLDDFGELDLDEVRDNNVRKYLQKNEALVKMTLM